jgi:cytochrome c553
MDSSKGSREAVMDERLRQTNKKTPSEGGCVRLVRKVVKAQVPVQAAILTILLALTCRTDAAVSQQELQAKMGYCKTCHGVEGRGFRGFYPIPRLAGQQVKYIENQLHAFIEHRRTNNIMFNVAHVLSPEMLTALATSFHNLNPEPLGGAPKGLATEGKKLFEEGIPNANVPPCATCHGAEAKGDADFPRLAGQLNDYIFAKLKNWSKERGQVPTNPDNSAIMEPIAHGLTDSQIRAVAAYVSNLQ